MIRTGDGSRKKALILQSISAALFLGLCILACFTAFWRDGEIQVSPLSASLMSIFFILLGVTVGIFAGSLLLKKKKSITLYVPAVLSLMTTLIMYVGEMILLHAHLYRFGEGFFFEGLPGIVLAPVDVVVILIAGLITYFLMLFVRKGDKALAENK
jgi:heme A synthase